MSELKKCPFCGSEPERDVRGWGYYCNNILCPLAEIDDFTGERALFDSNEWNTRPIEDALTARIAELEGALKHEENEKLTVSDADKSMIEWLRSKIARMEKAGDVLVHYTDYDDETYHWRCIHCGKTWKHIEMETHTPDCPVTEWQHVKEEK